MIATADAAQTAHSIRSMGVAIISLADAVAHAEQVQWLAPPASTKELTDCRPPAGGVKGPADLPRTLGAWITPCYRSRVCRLA